MPLFEYHCQDCDHDFEVLVRAGEKPQCPTCESTKLEKLMSASAARVGGMLSMTSACPPSSAPPCSPTCCRLPQ
ncbi:MAG: Zinc ribbon domain protein [Planctomycetaceae bacterium]|nr:Zinc ribbon domain protein [Planctomycetaceae bacterium]